MKQLNPLNLSAGLHVLQSATVGIQERTKREHYMELRFALLRRVPTRLQLRSGRRSPSFVARPGQANTCGVLGSCRPRFPRF